MIGENGQRRLNAGVALSHRPVTAVRGVKSGWMVHIRNDAGKGFYLFVEYPGEALRNTI
jgi:hypothetical protein